MFSVIVVYSFTGTVAGQYEGFRPSNEYFNRCTFHPSRLCQRPLARKSGVMGGPEVNAHVLWAFHSVVISIISS